MCEEFSQMEKYLTELEAYTTKYEWKVYRIFVLPPSFPYGGMENTALTFASPTIVVGE
jgi:leukotriene-A4 hydrolase